MPDAPSNLTADERALWEAEARMMPGEWENDSDEIFLGTPLPNSPAAVKVLFEADWGTNEDAHGIALARNAVRPLLEEIARLRGDNKRLKNDNKFAWEVIDDLKAQIAGEIGGEALGERKP